MYFLRTISLITTPYTFLLYFVILSRFSFEDNFYNHLTNVLKFRVNEAIKIYIPYQLSNYILIKGYITSGITHA